MDKGKNENIIKGYLIYGLVQGVGFRPFVYSLAVRHKVAGSVCNLGGIVEIIAKAPKDALHAFMEELRDEEGKDYEIHAIEEEDITEERFIREGQEEGFIIRASEESLHAFSLTPDIGLCDKCAGEVLEEGNRRYRHPFISCAACGPRYTILEQMPYDRQTTVMSEFHMCGACEGEYTAPGDRRFHAETISCKDCGPYLLWEDGKGGNGSRKREEAFEKAVDVLKKGGIIAVKGIGGYHYVCTPFSSETVKRLRLLKGREKKPFALCFPDIHTVKEFAEVSPEEEKLLASKAKPIILLYEKERRMAEEVSKESMYLGTFLPYTSIQLLLTKELGPLVMTSANLSGKPIIRRDEEMLSVESEYLEGVLYHRRKILRSVDDSVMKVTLGGPQMLRRSRGYVPLPLILEKKGPCIFSAGGDLKAAFCLYQEGRAVISQYFGDLEEYDILKEYENSYKDLKKLLAVEPELAVCDLHPGYFSRGFAKSLDLPLLQVQHHHAHIASVMAEHNLKGKVLGIAFDGTGYGTDGNVWGGEFLICEGGSFTRAGHLRYTSLIGGDASLKDARKLALCYLLQEGLEKEMQDERTPLIKAALKSGTNTYLTSSMGRLFDGVSALLGICRESRYEAEAAILLEQEARKALINGIEPAGLEFGIRIEEGMYRLDPAPLFLGLVRLKERKETGALALGFHYAVSEAVLYLCKEIKEKQNINDIALSGGVFANTLLLEKVTELLTENGFCVYRNEAVPPGDGCISLGQTFIGLERCEEYVRSNTGENN
ncbi:hydrogenase maturation protein HypF [Anaerocolumna jejuensis DSM 15929]|uniref:Carbamoyltransferase n=1 Tax=Anaerocolumna jejuensis DSM 15929 TaxID=1121322 RepID=A0A1M7C771_9FIRM|nr:carbamoyltransferase HypF [Anaerocolumna jejuensis]SHL63148.1 hydrogenase maturation protein HypF [Anaerocolumna jejuensis DSM 15929]